MEMLRRSATVGFIARALVAIPLGPASVGAACSQGQYPWGCMDPQYPYEGPSCEYGCRPMLYDYCTGIHMIFAEPDHTCALPQYGCDA